MNSAQVIQIIEKETRSLISGVLAELKNNLGTSHYRRLNDEELFRRGYAVYHHLGEWLASKDESPIQQAGEELGKRRFAEGIPLGQVVLALILEEKHLAEYLERSGVVMEESLRHTMTEFFQKTIYHTALGYEAALAQSNRLARRAVVSEKEAAPAVSRAPAPAEARKEEAELPTSRGGQVGEFGG